MGDAVGESVGFMDGDGVGESVGVIVGDDVGMSVGDIVGDLVGAFVGDSVGFMDGEEVGGLLSHKSQLNGQFSASADSLLHLKGLSTAKLQSLIFPLLIMW